MVGAARFELTTSGTQNQRSTRLSYAPNSAKIITKDALYITVSENRKRRSHLYQQSFVSVEVVTVRNGWSFCQ